MSHTTTGIEKKTPSLARLGLKKRTKRPKITNEETKETNEPNQRTRKLTENTDRDK